MSAIRALITGGGRGVGAAVAARMAARGARVVIAARTLAELNATATRIARSAGETAVRAIRCDVSQPSEVDAMAREAADFLGGIDVLVNNAGIAARALAHEMDEALWDAVLDVNLKGAWLCTRAVLPAMIARRAGRVINVASISATLGTARMSAYCASKWGLVGFTKSVAEEVREHGVQVAAVLPGSIDTAMLAGSGYSAAMSPDDVARTIEWLACDAPAAMTGSAVQMFG